MPTEIAARCLIDKSTVLEHIGRIDEALTAAQEGLALAAGGPYRWLIADCQLQVISVNIAACKYLEIDRYIRRCLAYCRTIGYEDGISYCHTCIGMTLDNSGLGRQAIECYSKSAEYKRTAGNLDGYAIALANIGSTYYSLGEYDEAEKYYSKALSASEQAGAKLTKSYVMEKIAAVLLVRGEYRAALEIYGQELAMNQMVGFRLGQAGNLHQIGFIHHVLGNNAEALHCLGKAVGIKRETNDRWSLACSLNLTARIHIDAGAPDQAIAYMDEGDAIASVVGNPDLFCRLAVTRGELALARKDAEQAASDQRRASEFADQAGLKNGKAEALLLRARIDAVRGDYRNAESRFREALSLFREMNDLLAQGTVQYCHGRSMADWGRTDEARAMLTEAAGTFRGIGAVTWLKRAEWALAAVAGTP
jgi:tetratricopeptide (TPR) repeat protein